MGEIDEERNIFIGEIFRKGEKILMRILFDDIRAKKLLKSGFKYSGATFF